MRVPAGLLGLLLSRLATVSLLLLVLGKILAGSSALYCSAVPQFARSSAQTVERRCRGTGRISLPFLLPGLVILEFSSSFLLRLPTFQVVGYGPDS